MKHSSIVSLIPAALIIAIASGGWWKLHSVRAAADAQLEQIRSETSDPAPGSEGGSTHSALRPSVAREFSGDDLVSLGAELARLESELGASKKAVELTRAETEEWLSKNPVAPDEVTSSFGRIRDMGREAAMVLRAMTAHMVVPEDPKDRPTKAERIQIEEGYNKFMKLMAWATLLGEMESIPGDIAEFQAAALSEFYHLDEPAAEKVQAIIAEHFAKIGDSGLTIADRPAAPTESEAETTPETDPRKDWRERRSAELEVLMLQLRPLLPERDPAIERSVLPGVLNLGLGVQSNIIRSADGKGHTTTMGLPTWPVPPWLPKADSE